jgi:hypothetical protein
MNTRNLLTLIASASLVALLACSTEDDAADKFASSDSFCTAKAEAECGTPTEKALAAKCGANPETCQKQRVSTCTSGASAATGQGRIYRASSAQPCIDSIKSTYKNSATDTTPDLEAETTKICDRVFSGSKKEADQCANTFECEGALICDKGVCITEDKIALKGQCNNAGAVCDTGTYCQQQGATKFCVEKNKLADACKVDAPCIETLRCVTDHCVAKVAGGGLCDNDGECAVESPYCDPVSKKCHPKYESSSPACKQYGL